MAEPDNIRDMIRQLMEQLKDRLTEQIPGFDVKLTQITGGESFDDLLRAITAASKVDGEDAKALKAESELALYASGGDHKQAIIKAIAVAHEKMHEVGNQIGIAGYLTAQLEPDPEHDGGDDHDVDLATERLAGWMEYMGKLAERAIKAQNRLCFAHGRFESNTREIPGRPKSQEQQEDDFLQFAKSLMTKPGNA